MFGFIHIFLSQKTIISSLHHAFSSNLTMTLGSCCLFSVSGIRGPVPLKISKGLMQGSPLANVINLHGTLSLIMHLCLEMQAVTKMAILAKFHQLTWRFLCKLHHQRWANALVNLTIWAISVTSWVKAEQKDTYFLRSLSVFSKRNTSSTMRVARKGNGKQYWYIFPLLFISFVL